MTLLPPAPHLDRLGRRTFRFAPAVLNVAQNRWIFRRATWGDIVVQNADSKVEVSIPRRFVGDISWINEATPVLNLLTPMELREGALWPAGRRVLEMPRAVNETARPRYAPPEEPAPVISIRLENRASSRGARLLVAGTALGVAGCLLAVTLTRGGLIGPRYLSASVMQAGFGLSSADGYAAVVHRFGPPATDRWITGEEEDHYRLLTYQHRGFVIVLSGATPNQAHFIGVLDLEGRPVAALRLSDGRSTYSLLRNLSLYTMPRF